MSVSDLLYGVVVQSGNDAAIALAEGISGTEDGFAEEMNYVARSLGMNNTNFRNSTGWPDPDQFTTARDLNILATALIRDFPVDRYPKLYPMFAERILPSTVSNRATAIPSFMERRVLTGAGHTEESGYGLVGSALRESACGHGFEWHGQHETEIIGSRRLMDLMFREFRLYKFFDAGEPVDHANVWQGFWKKLVLFWPNPCMR